MKILKTEISELDSRTIDVSLTLGDSADYEVSTNKLRVEMRVQRKGVSLELLQLIALQALAQSVRQVCDELQSKIVE